VKFDVIKGIEIFVYPLKVQREK